MAREAKLSKTRRLRDSTTHEEIDMTMCADGHFHLFLSHVWGDAQDQMRIIKQRLVEMLPDIAVFLDVDDLEEIGDLEGYIERTERILVYCSKAYFKSKNCMRELVSAAKMGKEIIALVDLDASKGGLSNQQVRERLSEAESRYEGWGFDPATTPSAQALYDHLFAHEPIEWNRLGHFQDVTMRLIAERLLPGSSGKTYVTGELVSQQLQPLPPPTEPNAYHLFFSAHNEGAAALMAEVAKERGMALKMESVAGEVKTLSLPLFKMPTVLRFSRATSELFAKARSSKRRIRLPLVVTDDPTHIGACDHFLLYLTASTWTRGEESDALAAKVREAMDRGMHILLAHEMRGTADGDAQRGGCDFSTFFSCPEGTTPTDLLHRGIYSEIAVPLKGGPWRKASMALLGMALGLSKEEAAAKAGEYGVKPETALGTIGGIVDVLQGKSSKLSRMSMAGSGGSGAVVKRGREKSASRSSRWGGGGLWSRSISSSASALPVAPAPVAASPMLSANVSPSDPVPVMTDLEDAPADTRDDANEVAEQSRRTYKRAAENEP